MSGCSALNLLIISQLLLAIIFFSSSSSSSAQPRYMTTNNPTVLPIYKFTNSPFYQVPLIIGGASALMLIDTGNDIALFPCSTPFRPLRCSDKQCKLVKASGCSSGCAFKLSYGRSNLTAILVQGVFTLGSNKINNYTFGCVSRTTGDSFPRQQGLLGLGRGPLSLLSQSTNLYNSTYSYCLPSSNKYKGILTLGPSPWPKNIPTTPLLPNRQRSTLYYVNLVGIAVNQKTLNIAPGAFAFSSTTGAGTVFDTGNMFTSLVPSAYKALKDEVMRQMQGFRPKPNGIYPPFDTCYDNVPIFKVKTITFMFANGMNMTLPPPNFTIKVGNSYCLAMTTAPNNINKNVNIIASYQQQNKKIMIDILNSKLSVADTTWCK